MNINTPTTPTDEITSFSVDLKSVLDNLPQAVLVVDRSLNIQYANMAAETVFQTSAAYLMKQGLEKFIPYGSPVLSAIDQVSSTGLAVNKYQLDISSPRMGNGKIVDINATPLQGNENNVVIMFRERGMADKIERQLTHRSAARSVTGLAAMLAHEIKNPLSGIRGAAQLLEAAVQEEEDKSLTTLIETEIDRIVKLVDRMEVFSDVRPIESEPINIHSIFEHVRSLALNGFAKNITIAEQYDPSLPLVSGDRDQLIQVFLNLIKNAAEAVKNVKDARIVISSAYRPGMHVTSPGSKRGSSLPLELSIIDNGPGVSEEIRAHIFEPFVTTRTNGSGLGLALVAKIIGNHGGIIECDSREGQTAFKVLLPAWQEVTGDSNG